MTHYYTIISTPLGKLTLQASDEGITGTWFETHTTKPEQLGIESPSHFVLQQAAKELTEYFAGKRTTFEVAVAASGTDFQRKVWQALRTIPYGQTWSYQQLAEAIDNPKAVRAVGLANGKNPVSIIVPCHRVIGKNGKLTGYAGGVERKEALLKLEGV
ncbi:methylated-DNA--[protein]-cysteine S-methyltransferase [Vibrio sp. TRT 17S01]|uniref:methylated-DNA--[protein]-cysteine S-methyltransferase n=1 Tax=Vibrio sp. TRT 17S01 TaxID=3418505 RepID=UPI003CF58114